MLKLLSSPIVVSSDKMARVPRAIGSNAMGRSSKCPVLIEMDVQRLPAGIKAPLRAKPVDVSLALREKGWWPFRVWFDTGEGAWIATVIYRDGTARHR
jgi:hypothetical protein